MFELHTLYLCLGFQAAAGAERHGDVHTTTGSATHGLWHAHALHHSGTVLCGVYKWHIARLRG